MLVAAMIHLTVPGEPVGKGRHRTIRGTGRTYTPKKTVEYEKKIQMWFLDSCPHPVPLSGPVCLKLGVFMTIPASASKRRRVAMQAGDILPTKKPDLDNIVKIVGDALNGLAFDDDKQIVTLLVAKAYSIRPRLEIEISKIGV